MGGFGSSRWIDYSPRYEVGECLRFDIQDFKQLLTTRMTYSVTYRWPEDSQINVKIDPLNALKLHSHLHKCSCIELLYKRGEVSITQPLEVDILAQHFGGWRLWLLCPYCMQRCRYLYMPPTNNHSSQIFLCRRCHNLTYRSSNDSHKNDAFFAGIGRKCGIKSVSELKRITKKTFNSGSTGVIRT